MGTERALLQELSSFISKQDFIYADITMGSWEYQRRIKELLAKPQPVTNEPNTTLSAAVMPNGVCVSNVYDAYEEGRKSVMAKQEPLSDE